MTSPPLGGDVMPPPPIGCGPPFHFVPFQTDDDFTMRYCELLTLVGNFDGDLERATIFPHSLQRATLHILLLLCDIEWTDSICNVALWRGPHIYKLKAAPGLPVAHVWSRTS